MKRILKNTTIVCLCFILIGIGFTICGWMLGGSFSFSYMPNMKKVVTYKDIEYHTVNEETEAFTSIDIQTDSKDIAIVTGDTFSISYSEDSSENNTYTVENGILKVNSDTNVGDFFFFKFDWSFINDPKQDVLTITVPEGTDLDTLSVKGSSGDCSCSLSRQTLNKVNMELNYGDVSIKNTTIKNADFDLQNGDLVLEGSQIDSLNAYLKYGECDIRNTTVDEGIFLLHDGDLDAKKFDSRTLELTLDYGDFSFSDGSIGTLNATFSDGDCDMKVNGVKENYNMALTAKDGEISIDGMEAEGYYNSTGSGGQGINVTDKYGDITIQFQ